MFILNEITNKISFNIFMLVVVRALSNILKIKLPPTCITTIFFLNSSLSTLIFEFKIFIFLFIVVSYSIKTKKNLKVDSRAKLAYEIF